MFNINKIYKKGLVNDKAGRIIFDIQVKDQHFIDTSIRELYKNKGECKIYNLSNVKYMLICDVDRLSGNIKSIVINVSDKKRYDSVLTVSLNNKKTIIDSIDISLNGDYLNDAICKVSEVCNLSEKYSNMPISNILKELNYITSERLVSLQSVGSTSFIYEKISDVLLKELQNMLPFNDISIWRDSSKTKEILPRKYRVIKINILYKNLIYNVVDIPITIDICKEKNSSVNSYRFKSIKYDLSENDNLNLNENENKLFRLVL